MAQFVILKINYLFQENYYKRRNYNEITMKDNKHNI